MVRPGSLADFYGFGDEVEYFLMDDSKLMLMVDGMPPPDFDAQADFPINFCLAAHNFFGTLNGLLNIIPHLV